MRLSLPAVAIFYGVMTLLGWGGAHLAGFNPWGSLTGPLWRDVALGSAVAAVVVGLSQVMEAQFDWAKRLSRGFGAIVGPITVGQAAVIALCSAVGEEVLFRGLIQGWLSRRVWPEDEQQLGAIVITGVIFGLVHIGPDWRTFWPWTLMAILMGWCFGWLAASTHNLAAPIIAHLLINLINLAIIGRQASRAT